MTETQYDLAFSFAGEQRVYVEATVRACQALGIKVFYDKDKNNDWWGSNFIREQRSVYSTQTRFFVPFISSEYLAKPIPMDEFSAAMMTSVKQGDGYILPVIMQGTRVPSDLLHPHIHYLRSEDYTPGELAAQFAQRIGTAESTGLPKAELGAVVEQALSLRMPKIVPNDYSRYTELDSIFSLLVENFTAGAKQLSEQGLIMSVRPREDSLVIRVERLGNVVAGLDVRKGTQMSDDSITWSVGLHRFAGGNSFNGWAKPIFDKERGERLIEINGLGTLTRGVEGPVTYSEFFAHMWDKVIDQIEQ